MTMSNDDESDDETICTFEIDRNPNLLIDRVEEKENVIRYDEETVVLNSNDIFDIIPLDVLARIFSGWLSVIDISFLDVAISGKYKRSTFLSSIRGAIFDGSEKPYGDDYIAWLYSRQVSVRKLKGKHFNDKSKVMLSLDKAAAFFLTEEKKNNLVWLDLENCKFSTLSFIGIIQSLTGLVFLNLKGSRVTDAVVHTIAINLSRLQSLNLKGCARISNASFYAIGFNCTNLKYLNISFCSKLTAFRGFSFRLPELEELELAGCSSLQINDLLRIVRESKGLRNLNLRYCQSISMIQLQILILRLKCLESVDLPNIDILLSNLIDLIDSCKNLKKLNCPPILNLSYFEKLRELYPNIEIDRYNSTKSCPG
jgi:uncharacterized protein YjbI with pentapeptide repeats